MMEGDEQDVLRRTNAKKSGAQRQAVLDVERIGGARAHPRVRVGARVAGVADVHVFEHRQRVENAGGSSSCRQRERRAKDVVPGGNRLQRALERARVQRAVQFRGAGDDVGASAAFEVLEKEQSFLRI